MKIVCYGSHRRKFLLVDKVYLTLGASQEHKLDIMLHYILQCSEGLSDSPASHNKQKRELRLQDIFYIKISVIVINIKHLPSPEKSAAQGP